MTIDTLRDALPDYAKDLKLNLGAVVSDATLNDQQKWGGLLAAALASRNASVIQAVSAEAATKLSPEALNAAKAAAAIMGMNNVYYRFTHEVSDKEYGKLPARLRMNVMANPGAPKIDFELWSLIVSAINGCGLCMDSHEQTLRKHSVSQDIVQQAVRIAAVVHAVAATLEGEQILAAA
ncbi:MAG: carboxymuconolactone decarboxylase family protein [Rhodospirillaceae bacterium]|nr:carboxymuconolactone decarboxylase family protein [Rhodospirillaceae bacterium]